MALRSLGSSLLAKTNPGGKYREKEEKEIQQPQIPQKGETGTLSRSLIQEPLERKVPPGSDKIVTAKPTIDETRTPGEAIPQEAAPNMLAGSMGRMVGFPAPAPSQAGGQFTQGITEPNPSPPSVASQTPSVASQAAPGGRVARSVSGGAAPGAAPVSDRSQVLGSQTTQQAPQVVRREGFLPTIASALSGRTIAAPEEGGEQVEDLSRGIGSTGVTRSGGVTSFTPTTSQFIQGAAGNLINTLGQLLGNPFPEKGISEAKQKYSQSPIPAIRGQGSISSAFNNLRSKAGDIFNGLRSLFGR
ncbi:MAG: hypothetical protein IPM48_14930 [Saprospiraceae bacterium]|nr:hypothetical protein [Saprospiraceae bacterium]